MSEVAFLLHFPGKDAIYVCRWWKGNACHLSSSSMWWRGDECWRHRGGLRRNSWCVKYQRTIFPSNVPLHSSSLVFAHILISVRVPWPQEKSPREGFWASMELPKHDLFACHCREPVLHKDSTQTVPEDCLKTSKPSWGNSTGEISRPFVVPQGEALPGAVPDRALLYGCLLKPARCPQA